jgi:hypothetical protein
MDAADSVAMYAAGVGTITAAWQIRQAVRARRPQVEVVLFNTVVQWGEKHEYLVWIQARNHGDHPVRVMGAGITDSKVSYIFGPDQGMMVLKGGHVVGMLKRESRDSTHDAHRFGPTMPGIVLARDAANRVLTDDEIAAFVAALLKQQELERGTDEAISDTDRSFIEDIILDLDGELTAWVELSTGQRFETEPKRLDWQLSGHTPECLAQPTIVCNCRTQERKLWDRWRHRVHAPRRA